MQEHLNQTWSQVDLEIIPRCQEIMKSLLLLWTMFSFVTVGNVIMDHANGSMTLREARSIGSRPLAFQISIVRIPWV